MAAAGGNSPSMTFMVNGEVRAAFALNLTIIDLKARCSCVGREASAALSSNMNHNSVLCGTTSMHKNIFDATANGPDHARHGRAIPPVTPAALIA
jgi:hypothetical protein